MQSWKEAFRASGYVDLAVLQLRYISIFLKKKTVIWQEANKSINTCTKNVAQSTRMFFLSVMTDDAQNFPDVCDPIQLSR